MICYVVWRPSSRPGEFEFLSNQKHWCESLKKVKKEVSYLIEEIMEMYDPPLTRKEAIEEMGGEPVIYKLIVSKVK